MAENNKALVWVIVGVVAVVLLMNSGMLNFGTKAPVSPLTCEIQPAVVAPTATDALQPGSAFSSVTYAVRKNGVYTGTSVPTVVKDDSIQYMVDNNTAIGVITDAFTVGCGNNPKEVQLKVYANATITVYSNAGNNILTNAAVGGAQNETATAVGGSLNNKIHMVGNDKKTTGKQLVVVEMSNPTNVSSLSLAGATSVAVPNGYARQLTNGYVAAFEIPALDGNAAVDYNIQASANTGYILSGAVYTTYYAEQPFVDTDGSFKLGAFNSLNAAKWQDKQTYNFFIA